MGRPGGDLSRAVDTVFTKDRLGVSFVVFGFCFCFFVVFLFVCFAVQHHEVFGDGNSKPDRPILFSFWFSLL